MFFTYWTDYEANFSLRYSIRVFQNATEESIWAKWGI
jgi:hypothetical protein